MSSSDQEDCGRRADHHMRHLPSPPTRNDPQPRRTIHAFMSWMVYLGVGAFVHIWQVGPSFNSSSLESWAWLSAWPVGLLGVFLWWVLIAAGVLLTAFAVYLLAYWLIPSFRRWMRSIA